MRLRIVPATRPEAALMATGSAQKKHSAIPIHSVCQLRNHIPARAGPICFMAKGAIQVADSSKITESVRTRAMAKEL